MIEMAQCLVKQLKKQRRKHRREINGLKSLLKEKGQEIMRLWEEIENRVPREWYNKILNDMPLMKALAEKEAT